MFTVQAKLRMGLVGPSLGCVHLNVHFKMTFDFELVSTIYAFSLNPTQLKSISTLFTQLI